MLHQSVISIRGKDNTTCMTDTCTYSNEYSYNANGALDHDLNRDIDMILYDDLGNTRQIFYFDHEQIEYIYSADGTKLRAIYRPAASSALTDSTDYVGSLILKNGQPSMYMFDGGFVTFNSNGAIGSSRMHYYIRDYMGNNRMVVNRSGTTEQITHYYPYGGVIGDISTNESLQKYKFEGKEFDRTFGLDNYDIHARQYYAMMPSWDKIDPMAEKYYGISPYAYCGGDPVNRGDYNGKYISLGDNPSWSLISGYAIARGELSRVGADKNLRALEMDMTCVVTIVEIRPDDCDGNQFDYKSNTIFWSPERGSIRQVDLEDSSLSCPEIY